jgi:glutamate racemase
MASALNLERPIGVFDSGLGGLRVLKHLFQAMPYKDFMYFADLRHMPYGARASENIVALSQHNIQWLSQKGCKLVLAACHTSTTCLEVSQSVSYPYFLSMANSLYETIHHATTQHGLNSVAILGTEATIRSQVYQRALSRRLPKLQCRGVACPTWVSAIESGSETAKRYVVHSILSQLEGVDALVYGCTHFSEMECLLQEYAPNVLRLDPACTLASTLRGHVSFLPTQRCGTVRVFTNVARALLLKQYAEDMFGVAVEYI